MGQEAKEINVYLFTANTGVENIIFRKQHSKLMILDELRIGCQQSKIPKVNMNDVIQLIEMEDNQKKLKNIKYY